MNDPRYPTLKFFECSHLPEELQTIAAPCAALADCMVDELSETVNKAELATGLRKLLEAKDCFVRAAL